MAATFQTAIYVLVRPPGRDSAATDSDHNDLLDLFSEAKLVGTDTFVNFSGHGPHFIQFIDSHKPFGHSVNSETTFIVAGS